MCADVHIVGQMYSDLVFAGARPPEPGSEVYAESFTLSPGGAANRAVAAARIGASATLSADVGDDPIGTLVLAQLAQEPHLDLTHLRHRPGSHNPITVAITDGPDRAFVTYEEPAMPPEWDGAAAPATLHLSVEKPLPPWLSSLRQQGTAVFGGVGWDATGAWSPEVLTRIRDVDAVVFNDAEACAYTRTSTPEEALAALSGYVETAVVTLGKDGALATRAGTTVQVPSLPVTAVDPTGAGDTFGAVFMATTAWGWELEAGLRLAAAAAACSVRAPGGARSAPTPTDLHDLFEELQPARGWDVVRQWARQQSEGVHGSTHAAPVTSERKS